MDALGWWQVRCPYCGEPIEVPVDTGDGGHRLVEDCPVCCRPIEVVIDVAPDGAETVTVATGDER